MKSPLYKGLNSGSKMCTCCITLLQVHWGAAPGLPWHQLQPLGLVGKPPGSGAHDGHLPYHRLSQTQIHQEIHLKVSFW